MTGSPMVQALESGLEALQLPLSLPQRTQALAYLALIERWNRV